MKTLLRHRGLAGLFFAQSQVAFTDNAAKLVLIGLVQMLLPADAASKSAGLIALLLVSPFFLFAPLVGWMSDRFSKHSVLAGSLWLQAAIMGVMMLAASWQVLPVAIAGLFFLGIQSAMMSPARRGMVKELAGDNVPQAVGWMEMLCIAAILAGSFAGGQLIDGFTPHMGTWPAAFASFTLLAAGCVVALRAFHKAPSQPPANPNIPFRWKMLFGHGELFSLLRKDRSIWRAALGDAIFSLVGGMLMLTLTDTARLMHPDGVGAARTTGIMLALVGAGIAVGSIVAATLSRRTISMALVPIGALGMALILAALIIVPTGSVLFHIALFAVGIFGGQYLVPLGAFLVSKTPESERGRILAASSMLSSLAGVGAVAIHWLIAGHLPASAQFVVMAAIFLLAAGVSLKLLKRDVLQSIALMLSRTHYSVKAVGTLPEEGGALIVCNHVSYVDTIILSLASKRPIRFLSYEGFFSTPVLGSLLRCFGAIPVSDKRAADAIRKAAEHIRAGELVCIFPEGQLTRTGCLMELKGGFSLIARRAECPVIVAHLDGLWGSIFSFEGGRYFTKWPQSIRRRATVSFSKPMSYGIPVEEVRATMLELGADAFASRTHNQDLSSALAGSLKADAFRVVLQDGTKPIRGIELLAASKLLARKWKNLPGHRIGIILPPGAAGIIANLAILFVGKVPVNINPLLSEESAAKGLENAGVRSIITAGVIQKKLTRFPWPAHVILMEDAIARLAQPKKSAKRSRASWFRRSKQASAMKRQSCSSPAEQAACPQWSP